MRPSRRTSSSSCRPISKSLERQIGGNVADYANWDDAVEHLVLNSDTDWATRNVGPTVNATLGYELSLVLNQAGNASYGQVDGTTDTNRAVAAFGPDLARFAEQGRGGGPTGKEPAVAVLAGAEGLVIAAASAVAPEEGSTLSLPPGPPVILLFGKRLDQALLRRIEDDYGLAGLAFVAPSAVGANLASVESGRPRRQARRAHCLDTTASRPRSTGMDAAGSGRRAAGHRHLRQPRPASDAVASALRRTEARLRDFAEVSSDWLWEMDARLRLAWLSSSFALSTGLAPEKVLGRRRDELGGTALGDGGLADAPCDLAAQRPFRGFTYCNRRRYRANAYRCVSPASRCWTAATASAAIVAPAAM